MVHHPWNLARAGMRQPAQQTASSVFDAAVSTKCLVHLPFLHLDAGKVGDRCPVAWLGMVNHRGCFPCVSGVRQVNKHSSW